MLYIANTSDYLSPRQCSQLLAEGNLVISAKHQQGIDTLLDCIGNIIGDKFTSNSNILITRARYHEALSAALSSLKLFNLDKEIELSAEDIRLAAREIGKITGRIEVDEVLDKIFGSFCIGK